MFTSATQIHFVFAVIIISFLRVQASGNSSLGKSVSKKHTNVAIEVSIPGQDHADSSMYEWSNNHPTGIATGSHGENVPSLTATLGIGDRGPLLLQDFNFQTFVGNFANERIPERVVHAKGAGALGYFVVTNQLIAKYTRAKLFSKVGKRTPVVVRFSTVAGELGSADTVLDLRGFAVKFKTEEGNYDLMMLNTIVFMVRDSIRFISLNRSRKRYGQTFLFSANTFWDFVSLRPETTFNTLLAHSDMGLFKNYRHMEGHSLNSFKWETGEVVEASQQLFVRYHLKPNLKKAVLSTEMYKKLAGSDPDYFIRDLYNAIAKKKFPSWTVKVQMFTMDQAKKSKFNLFDPTNILPEKNFPMITIGKLVLSKNPQNFFADVEQVTFNPFNLVPGIAPSPDRVLQGRGFAYLVAQAHRVGSNANQLPINRPAKSVREATYLRDGFMNTGGNGDGGPTYYPNSFSGPTVDITAAPPTYPVAGGTVDYVDTGDEDNLSQIDVYWREVMSVGERKRTIKAMAANLARATPEIQERSLKVNWDPINDEIKTMLRDELAKANAALQKRKRKRKRVNKSLKLN